VQICRRTAALLEVFGVYLTGAFLSDQVAQLLVRWRVISPQNPLQLLTVHMTNTELLVASRQLLLTLILLYGSYFALIIPINWWYRRRGRAAYGLTRAGRSGKALLLAALATAVLTQWPVLVHTLVDAVHPLGPMEPWRQAFFDMSWRMAVLAVCRNPELCGNSDNRGTHLSRILSAPPRRRLGRWPGNCGNRMLFYLRA
jgi:hypothetical protein